MLENNLEYILLFNKYLRIKPINFLIFVKNYFQNENLAVIYPF